jgi:predicted phage terminase large subunit-like protein
MIQSTHYEPFRPRLTNYIPHTPTVKQRAFLCLSNEEAFYGGAAGGGKSDALLMAALQYVDVPGYSAVIIRKTLADARKPSSILSRARTWLSNTDAVWVGAENSWYFPSGARLDFGKLGQVGDRESYQSAEYTFCGFDELTHFYEEDFDYVVMSRLRRTKCPKHDKGNFSDSCRTCAQYARLSQVPLRIRTASNPGGKGHIWVKRRYDIRKVPGMKTPNGRQLYAGQNRERPHIPAYVTDNPYIDKAEYMSQLMKMSDPVTREQLLSGDWGVSDEGRFKMEWVRRYQMKAPYVELTGHGAFRLNQLETFIIIDPAASRTSTPGTKEITKKIASHTAAGVFSLTPDGNMVVRHVERHQKEVPQIKHMIRKLLRMFPDSQFVGMELSTMSTHLYQMLCAEGFNIRAFKHGGRDKIARSVQAANEMESGRIWLPDTPSIWLQDFEDEIFTWTGDPDEVDDQIDVLSYAAMHKQTRAMNGYGLLTAEDLPCVI